MLLRMAVNTCGVQQCKALHTIHGHLFYFHLVALWCSFQTLIGRQSTRRGALCSQLLCRPSETFCDLAVRLLIYALITVSPVEAWRQSHHPRPWPMQLRGCLPCPWHKAEDAAHAVSHVKAAQKITTNLRWLGVAKMFTNINS